MRRLSRAILNSSGGYAHKIGMCVALNRAHPVSNGFVMRLEGQRPVLHLVSSTERVAASGLPFTFTNGHAEMLTSSFYEDLADLDKVDWEIMKAVMWRDTDEDMTRKWRRQAEFLVHNHFPVNLIAGIGVISNKVAASVKQILAETGHQIPVALRPNWYY